MHAYFTQIEGYRVRYWEGGDGFPVLMLHGVQQGILSGLIALAAYGYAVATIGASRASAFVSLTPALTALLGAWALGEKLDPASVSAILLVGVGVALASGVGQEISLKMRALRAQP